MVTIRTYDNYIHAHIAKGQLEDRGISVFLRDEFMVTIDPLLTNAIGGIKLTVRDDQSNEADLILSEFESDAKAKQVCPHCGSLKVEFIATAEPKNWLSALFSILTGILYTTPVVKKYHCFSCGYEFKAVADALTETNS